MKPPNKGHLTLLGLHGVYRKSLVVLLIVVAIANTVLEDDHKSAAIIILQIIWLLSLQRIPHIKCRLHGLAKAYELIDEHN